MLVIFGVECGHRRTQLAFGLVVGSSCLFNHGGDKIAHKAGGGTEDALYIEVPVK